MTRFRLAPAIGVIVLMTAALIPAAGAAPVAPVSTNVGCDPIDPSMCLFPFPNDFFTVADATTDTGRRVNFSPAAMPRGGAEITEGGEGKPVDPTEWNRNDGFSPGSLILTYVPGLDLPATWGTAERSHSTVGPNETGYFDYRDQITDIGLSLRSDSPMVLLNAETGERHPFWSELDTQPAAVAGGEQALMIRPASNLEEGARYIVALRNMKRSDGSVIEPGPEFAGYISNAGADPARQQHYDQNILPALENAGIGIGDLYLAWDFTVASERNLSERVLHMRDDAFGRILGDTNLADRIPQGVSPTFEVDSISERTDNWTDSNGVAHSQAMRRVKGRITVPNYMDRLQQTEAKVKENEDTDQTPAGERVPLDLPAPGSRLLDLNQDGLPDQNPAEPTINASFICDVPLDKPRFPMLYGHGLLGDRYQVGDLKSPRRDGPFMGCAADWWGMSFADIPTVASLLADGSNFPSLPDRAQQGFLNFMFLGRALVHPDGFASDDAFQLDGQPLIQLADRGDPVNLYYDGNSQGGIMGGSLIALSPDIRRGVLGVVGMNYSTLLQRSVDWEDPYAIPFYEVYRDPMERQVMFALMQMLWDRGEANGYAAHMTDDPYPNTPSHEVLLQVAYGDHQVANVSAEVEARTIGAPIMQPGLPDTKHWAPQYFGPTAGYPYRGSSLVYWDSGNASPPNGNIAPTHSSDPHSHPRNEPASSWQEAQFLLTGWMVDVCGDAPYLTLRNPINNGTPSCHPPEWEPGSRAY